MEIFGKNFKLSTSVVILIILFLFLGGAFLFYFKIEEPGSKWGGFCGSLAAGMVVALIQFIIAWQDFKETEKLKKLRLKEILYNRATRSKYEEFIKKANREIDVMGVTAVRFFNDFADTSTGAPEDATVLLQALRRGVYVRVLLPADDYLSDEKKNDANKVRMKYQELTSQGLKLEIRYFDHIAAHSIFRIDDTCIVGPVFPDIESRNTPALHVEKSSPFALNYMDYFESQWEEAKKA